MTTIDREVFRETQELVEYSLQDLIGLCMALRVCASDHSALSTSDPTNQSINVLIGIIQDRAEMAMKLHEASWDAVMKPQVTGDLDRGAGADRG